MMRIAIAGKGGTGKTTLAALMIGALKACGMAPILAVDADPNDNLGPAIGMAVTRTLGEIREDFIDRSPDIPPGMTKEYVEEVPRNSIKEITDHVHDWLFPEKKEEGEAKGGEPLEA